MKTLTHVEDYIEELAGIATLTITSIFTPLGMQSPPGSVHTYSLARYDEQVVTSMAESTCYARSALTDRQADLSLKLLQTYKRQFAKNGIDVTPMIEKPEFRLPLRIIDRSKRAWLKDDTIQLYFPYSKELVSAAQKYKLSSFGAMDWDSTTKLWTLGLTEANVNWVVTWGKANNFDVSNELCKMLDIILECEKTPFEIELVKHGNGYTISHANDNLLDYVNTHLGGFGQDNLVRLVDNAGVLGYKVSKELEFPLLADFFDSKRQTHVPSDIKGALDILFDYAELTQRYPICIYDPSTIGIDLSRFKEEEIMAFDVYGKTKSCDVITKNVKVVYAHKLPKEWNSTIPLLVSTVEMLYGGKRTEWLSRAEKVVYYCKTLLKDINEWQQPD